MAFSRCVEVRERGGESVNCFIVCLFSSEYNYPHYSQMNLRGRYILQLVVY